MLFPRFAGLLIVCNTMLSRQTGWCLDGKPSLDGSSLAHDQLGTQVYTAWVILPWVGDMSTQRRHTTNPYLWFCSVGLVSD